MSAYPRAASVLGALALSAAVLAGCAGPGVAPDDSGIEPTAAWLDGGAMIGLLVAGSSTCVPVADETTYDDGVLTVVFVEPDRPCSRDLVVRGVPVTLPGGVDPADDLRIEVRSGDATGAVELPGVAGLVPGDGIEGGQPSAGWAGADVFALLTWGSSSCPPEVTDAVAAASGEVAVTFTDPPADRACTADFTARVTPVTVADAAPGVEYVAVLSGDSFDGARVPIAGTP